MKRILIHQQLEEFLLLARKAAVLEVLVCELQQVSDCVQLSIMYEEQRQFNLLSREVSLERGAEIRGVLEQASINLKVF